MTDTLREPEHCYIEPACVERGEPTDGDDGCYCDCDGCAESSNREIEDAE